MSYDFSREVPRSRVRSSSESCWSASRSHGLVRSLNPRERSCHRTRSSIPRFTFGPRIAGRVYDVREKETTVNATARRKDRARVLDYWVLHVPWIRERKKKRSRTTSTRWKDTFSAPLRRTLCAMDSSRDRRLSRLPHSKISVSD